MSTCPTCLQLRFSGTHAESGRDAALRQRRSRYNSKNKEQVHEWGEASPQQEGVGETVRSMSHGQKSYVMRILRSQVSNTAIAVRLVTAKIERRPRLHGYASAIRVRERH
jgi:hypothetical protein